MHFLNRPDYLFSPSLSADENAARNLRPQSREISLEEEKAAVLSEMRKVSESSDE